MNIDSYSKALVEVSTVREHQRWVELLESELIRVSDGVFDAKGVLASILEREKKSE